MVWSSVLGDGTDPRYRQAIGLPHRIYTRLDITDHYGNVLVSDVPFQGGSVTCTLQSRVTRQLSTTLDRSWFPVGANGKIDTSQPLTPYGNRLRFWRGITYGDGSVVQFPVFYGRIDSVSLDRGGVVNVIGFDVAADVVEADFEAPQSSVTTNTITNEFQRLCRDALRIGGVDAATFGTSDTSAAKTPTLNYTNDRGRALDDLSAAGNLIWYALADGSLVQRTPPWTKPGRVPVMTYLAGDDPTSATNGRLLDYKITLARTGINNKVIFVSQRLDGSAPVQGSAQDNNPTSPTYYLGPFGKKPVTITNQSALNQGQCQAAAQTLLNQSLALTQTWASPTSITCDPSLELGDIATFSADGVTSVQVMTGFTVPMWETDAMPVTLRAYVPTSS